jgi:hypothetical protein
MDTGFFVDLLPVHVFDCLLQAAEHLVEPGPLKIIGQLLNLI